MKEKSRPTIEQLRARAQRGNGKNSISKKTNVMIRKMLEKKRQNKDDLFMGVLKEEKEM